MTPEDHGQAEATGRACECGHPLAEHAESGWGPNSVCVEVMADPDAGWFGVCPCVRHGEETR